jgi:GLPGLI family protein
MDIELPKEVTITAWYTLKFLLVRRILGFPGLILEVNDGKTTILCSKIVLNKGKIEIKALTKEK